MEPTVPDVPLGVTQISAVAACMHWLTHRPRSLGTRDLKRRLRLLKPPTLGPVRTTLWCSAALEGQAPSRAARGREPSMRRTRSSRCVRAGRGPQARGALRALSLLGQQRRRVNPADSPHRGSSRQAAVPAARARSDDIRSHVDREWLRTLVSERAGGDAPPATRTTLLRDTCQSAAGW